MWGFKMTEWVRAPRVGDGSDGGGESSALGGTSHLPAARCVPQLSAPFSSIPGVPRDSEARSLALPVPPEESCEQLWGLEQGEVNCDPGKWSGFLPEVSRVTASPAEGTIHAVTGANMGNTRQAWRWRCMRKGMMGDRAQQRDARRQPGCVSSREDQPRLLPEQVPARRVWGQEGLTHRSCLILLQRLGP